MAFACLIYHARKLKTRKQTLLREKQNALKIHLGLLPKYTLIDRIRHCFIDLGVFLKKIVTFDYLPQIRRFKVYLKKIKTDGTFENYIAKSVVGYIGGLLLTYIIFVIIILQLNVSLGAGTLLCCILGVIFTIGLAFSQTVRCIVLLSLPLFFSKRGRQALIAYIFVLVLSGPAKNTIHNTVILSESLACGQEQLKTAVKQIIDTIKKPFLAIKNILKKILEIIKVIVKKIKEILLSIKRVILSIVEIIKSVFVWLFNIVNMCNKKVGTPFQRCMRVMDNGIADCQAKLGKMFSWICSVTYVAKSICWITKPLDLICVVIEFVDQNIIELVSNKLKIFLRHIKTFFDVRIRFSHSFKFESTHSKSIREITSEIMGEVKQRVKNVLKTFHFINFGLLMGFCLIFVRAMYYRYKFLTSTRFDNHFITVEIFEMDFQRAKLGQETILPLNHREKNKYIMATSMRLTKKERKNLSKSIAFLLTTTLRICLFLFFDYSLYWILAKIRYYGRIETHIDAPNTVGIHVQGTGLLAKLYRGIVKAFRPLGANMNIDSVPCLPDPIHPNFDRYFQIGFLMGLCWFLTIFEPYGLRLRHAVMCLYHPHKAKERAVWLYNHILRARMSFLKYARRQLRRTFGGTKYEKVTLLEFLRAHINNPFLRLFLTKDESRGCLLCGIIERDNTRDDFIKCWQPNCIGFYCRKCFQDLKNLCPICKNPLEYGDVSDVSEEVDSSEEDELKEKSEETIREEIEGEITDNESIYSFDYQYEEKDRPSSIDEYERSSFIDLEKQRFSDYASMNLHKSRAMTDFPSDIESSEEKDKHKIVENKKKENILQRISQKIKNKIMPSKKKRTTEQEQPLLPDEDNIEMNTDDDVRTIFFSRNEDPFESKINLTPSEIEDFASNTSSSVASTIYKIKRDVVNEKPNQQNTEKNVLTNVQVQYVPDVKYLNPLPYMTTYKINKYFQSLTNLPTNIYNFTQMFEQNVKILNIDEKLNTDFRNYSDESQLHAFNYYSNKMFNFEIDKKVIDDSDKSEKKLINIEQHNISFSSPSSRSNTNSDSTDSFIQKSRDYYKYLRKRYSIGSI